MCWKEDRENGEFFFVEKSIKGSLRPLSFGGFLTQQARHTKSQSAATFWKGAMLNYTTIDPYNASLERVGK